MGSVGEDFKMRLLLILVIFVLLAEDKFRDQFPLPATNRHVLAAPGDQIVIVDATLGGYTTKCGNQIITGWTSNINTAAKDAADTLYPNPFNTGTGRFQLDTNTGQTFKNGYYHVCAFFRFKNSGNSNDVTILHNGAVYAAFGNADQSDWRSTGVCVVMYLLPTDYVEMKQQSGGSSDCIEETGWYYSRFMINNIAAMAWYMLLRNQDINSI